MPSRAKYEENKKKKTMTLSPKAIGRIDLFASALNVSHSEFIELFARNPELIVQKLSIKGLFKEDCLEDKISA